MRIFEVISMKNVYKKFIQGTEISTVALPLVEDAGMYFPYTIGKERRVGTSIQESDSVEEKGIQLTDVSTFFQGNGMNVILHISPALPDLSLDSGACDLTDQIGRRAAHTCLNNSRAQGYINLLVTQALTKLGAQAGDRLTGVALNVTDLWPMSASSGRFLATCFCHDCVSKLKSFSDRLDPNWFTGFPNALNLASAETIAKDENGEDIGGIATVNNLMIGMDPNEVIEACSQVRGTAPALAIDRGTFEAERPQFTRWARQLMMYFEAKSHLSASACATVFQGCRSVLPNIRRIVISESDDYGWLSGLFLDQFDSRLADELWTPITPKRLPTDIRVVPMLARRAGYYVQAYFDTLNVIHSKRLKNVIARLTTGKELWRRARRHAESALSEIPRRSGDAVLSEGMNPDVGAVSVALDQEIVDSLARIAWSDLGYEDAPE
jgi:hypothetical protein